MSGALKDVVMVFDISVTTQALICVVLVISGNSGVHRKYVMCQLDEMLLQVGKSSCSQFICSPVDYVESVVIKVVVGFEVS
jgi:hypothetical protein